ncbi:MAG: hypothetical protein NTW03_14025, partial [Verrucomicrobia bacterium]|nr:hypothetical protein [Verrucomicrobiota bacterium]
RHPMFNSILKSFRRSTAPALAVALLAAAPAVPAQNGLSDIVYTVGTTVTDSTGRNWAFMVWQATTPSLLSGQSFAVYSKAGDVTSTAPFVRRSIEPLLRRSENIGEDSFKLGDDMMQLFANLMPTNTISRADQLSAVIRGSLMDDTHYQNLVLLARNHPGVALCLGLADAQMISAGKTTFEIRNFDAVLNQDVAVVARVTVDTANPTVLPRPGTPVLMPETSARGDINLKFRWGTPDNLRRLGLMQFGYNLWRVTKSYAVSQSWHVTPPTPTALTNAWAATANVAVRRVNRLPIVSSKQFTVAEAALITPPGDTNTFFIADDDGRFDPGYANYGFTNGAQFYYFVAARDVLARNGLVSTGLLATVCDRLPPSVPMQVKVINDYSYDSAPHAQRQVLRVTWNQITNLNEAVTNYWVYRWTSMGQINAQSYSVSNQLLAVVPHLPGQARNSYLDNGAGSPDTTNDLGKTFWYTVRAGDSGACGQNLSANSGPAFGVLRDRVGPAAGTGWATINCPQPQATYVGSSPKPGGTSTNFDFVVTYTRINPQIAWAEAYVIWRDPDQPTYQTNQLGRHYFGVGGSLVSIPWSVSRAGQKSPEVRFYCRIGTYNGKVSDYKSSGIAQLPAARYLATVDFSARLAANSVVVGPQVGGDCTTHDPVDPETGLIPPIIVTFLPTETSQEWRLYRRVDTGPLSLICQGNITNVWDALNCIDDSLPPNSATMCYFLQLFDEHGNPSPLTKLLCLDCGSSQNLPVPLLSPITAAGHTNNPSMNLVWFCPPFGLDRFEVWIGVDKSSASDPGLSSMLVCTSAAPAELTFTNQGTNYTFQFFPYRTPHPAMAARSSRFPPISRWAGTTPSSSRPSARTIRSARPATSRCSSGTPLTRPAPPCPGPRAACRPRAPPLAPSTPTSSPILTRTPASTAPTMGLLSCSALWTCPSPISAYARFRNRCRFCLIRTIT